ncbi:GNAT family N-acetyltransferase [Wenzhouxiangella limi]|uniref:GNAT family N-acetyltransferase n=1 Tax=Wenzhouxiangella limi TaxID=2707351 RepID=A0A845V178_9GAMM|nr:GNAT family N-acetyltransferase [Wenzhouxiangella limi]NDY96362.1 GNAT family N-acetyltransferase [Wenzhouxiangella limi]
MNSGAVNIRRAARGDEDSILGLIGELAEYERLAHEVTATPALLAEHLFGDNAVAEALLAEIDGAAVGFALFFRNFSTFLGRPGLYLEDLYVREACRGRGIGRALLKRLADLARERGYGRMEWSVLNWNQPAIEFYQSLGAEAMSDWTVYRLSRDGQVPELPPPAGPKYR